MTFPPPLSRPAWRAALALVALAIAGCAGTPPGPAAPGAAPAPGATPGIAPVERRVVDVGGNLAVDYRIERKISEVNRTACYAYITGTLYNGTDDYLSRRTVIDFNFMHRGRQVFRDLTMPVTDVPPRTRVQFQMVTSPVHREGCVAYDPIVVQVRKVVSD